MNRVILSASDVSRIYNQVFSACDRLGVSRFDYDSIVVELEVDHASGIVRVSVGVPHEGPKGKREQ